MAPFVSVIVPVYNAEKYLRECLDSVVNQTLRDIEIICVDDGSTDSSPAVLAEYAARDSRVRVLTQENAGVGPARNAGIRAARGEFVAFLDPDDLLPDASVYEALYFYAKENRVRVCGGGVCSLANDGKRYFPDASWGANVDQAFPREGFMRFADWQFDYGFYRYIFERRLLLDDEIFFPPYIRYQDPPFCARALEAAGEFYALRRTTYVFRDWHTPDYTEPRRVCDQLRGVRDQLKFSRERGYAKLHWLQLHRLFEEFKPHVLALVEREKNGEDVPADQSAIALLKEIDELADVRLARRHSADTPYYSVDAEFLHPEIKVSVIIPVYNVEKYLRQCLDSIVNQTLRDIEIICINDGSPDNSLSILQEYAKRDSRFVIVDQENQGVGRSRNTGIRKARGEFVCFMDPDDWYPEPDILETLYSTAKRERVCICGGSLEEHKPDGTVVRDFNPNASNWGGKFSQDGIMRFRDYQYDWGYQRFVFSRKFLVVNDIFFPPYIRFQDPPFFVKAMVLAEKFYALRKITYAYRVAYKEPIFSNPRKLSDMFSGIADVVNLAQTYGLEKLTERLFNQNYQSKWALPQILETAEKSLEVATKIKRTFDLFPEELRWTANALWWNFDKRSPIVSVVVPVYNAEKYLRRCLDSLCGQTLRNIEIVCVNDGSTDSSLQILQEYAGSDSRVKIFSQKNGGEGAAKNAGISHSTGKYVAILDPDDYVDSDFYEKLARVALKNGTVVTKGESKIEKDGEVSAPSYDLNAFILENTGKLPLFSRFYYQHCTAVYVREFLTKNKITFGLASVGADLEFLLKLGMRTESISIVPGAFHYYVQSSEGVSRIYNDSYFNANLAYTNSCVDLLNTRNKFDSGYYIYLKGRLTQLLDVVLPQFVQRESDFSAIKSFLEEATKIVNKIRDLKKLINLFPAGDSSNAFAFLSFGAEEVMARMALSRETTFKSEKPFVSVVVPVYNTGKYLRECLDSICGQTLRNIEIICVNDGSTDGSLSILEEYVARDPRVRVFSQENFGQGHARNVGLDLARGEYVYFMDSDDCLPLAALQKEYACAKAAELDMLLFEGESRYETEELAARFPAYKELYLRKGNYPGVLSGTQIAVLLKGNRAAFVSPCCFLSKREFLAQNKLRFPEGYFYEDNVFFFALLKAAERVSVVHEKLFVRRVREGSTMTKPIGFRNFLGYAHVIAELEKLAREGTDDGFKKVLLDTSAWMSRAIAGYYETFSPEDRARSRELLAGALKDSAWLDVARERIDKIDTEENEVQVTARETARPAAGTAEAPASAKKIYPAFLVRLGAAFILNKAARKRWRERHMDLTPKDGIDVNAHPELRRDSALKRFAVRAASLFIFSKKKRKAFRAKHLNLRPRDGVDVRELSSKELARLREAKRSRSTLWRVFDALVPATRGKIAHTERHLRRAAEEQTRILIDELRRMHDENRRAFDESRRVVDENRRALGAVRAELKTVRERADALSRELAASKTELKDRTLATERALRAELSATREALTLKTLAAKHAALDAESNLQARLGEVLESLNAARSEFAQAAAETVRAVNARADALPRMFEEALARNAESTKSALLAAKTELCASVEAAEKQLQEALAKSVPESEARVLAAVETQARTTAEIRKFAEDSAWASVFNSTIAGSAWLRDAAFSPGRWAVGYPFLYVLYRVLNDGKPRSILETGLGQSTRMIAQYAAAHAGTEHTVVEHDATWIRFFGESFALPPSTQVAHLPLTKTWRYGEDAEIVAYEGFGERFRGRKFDLISLDGPFGFMAKTYARADILPLIPECLAESFVILIDDFEREGERATVAELTRILRERGVAFREATYSGIKQMRIIVSPDKKFLCSL